MTYSIATTGAPADNLYQPVNLTVDDTVATTGNQARAMMTGEQFLARGPDGGQALYVYDSERSVPGERRVLRRVSP